MINIYTNPFYFIKVGTSKGYGGDEALCWNQSERPYVGVQHILARVKFEMELIKNKNIKWYPFGVKWNPNRSLFFINEKLT